MFASLQDACFDDHAIPRSRESPFLKRW